MGAMQLQRRTLDQIHSPIGEAFALVGLRTNDRPMLDLSQAAPSFPAAPSVVDAIQQHAAHPDGGRYARQKGLPHLCDAFADELSRAYGATVDAEQVMITAGCNQAFTLISSALASPGDSIMIPVPYYFNHDMWLRLDNLSVTHLPTGEGAGPDVATAESLLTERTRAMVLVTPGNPTGAILTPDTIADFADLARRRDIVLIIDETYRSYRSTEAPAHREFSRPGWDDHVVSLHSFSKEFAIPGYRVGAAVGHPALLAEAMKLLDCVAICAPRIGQEAAYAGLTTAIEWREEQVARIGAVQERFETMMAERPGGWELASSGAYFGWARHPFGVEPTLDVVRRLVLDHDVLTIPGTAFTPADEGYVRVSFTNLDEPEVHLLAERLSEAPSAS